MSTRKMGACLGAICLSSVLAGSVRAQPTIEITALPPYGGQGYLEGVVTGVDFSTHLVAPFIQIEGKGWHEKPTTASPKVLIGDNGSFKVHLGTAGIDDRATIYGAALVHEDYPPQD